MTCKWVRDIKQRDKAQPIEVRALKKWKSTTKNKEICYQFVDTHGDGIEATIDEDDEEYFDSIIQLNSCYQVTNYICNSSRMYMATVNREASLIFGRKAKFVQLSNSNLPTVCFDFQTYDVLKERMNNKLLLTDYIGRVEKNSIRTTSKGKRLRKVLLQDESKNMVEITLWPDMKHLIGDEVVPADIIAITSTSVTEFNGMIQLESTFLTTIVINPSHPETTEHVYRLKALPTMQTTEMNAKQVTIQELLSNKPLNNQGHKQFTCQARIKEIQVHQGWYYVLCSKCPKMLYPEENGPLNFVCKDDNDVVPNFMYCVNATIIDASGTTDVILFNEGMTAMLKISCTDMVMKYGNTDPRELPHQMASIIDKPNLLHLSVKNDKIIVIDVTEPLQQQRAINLPPTTPDQKINISNKHYESPGTSKEPKRKSSTLETYELKRTSKERRPKK